MSIHVVTWVLEHSEARLGNRLVALVLADHAKKDGTCAWPSVETIGHEARMSKRQVQRALKTLAEDGEIVEQGRSKSGTVVYAFPRYVMWRRGDNMAPPAAGGVTNPPRGGDKSDEIVSEMSPEPSLEPSGTVPTAKGKAVAVIPGWKVAHKPVTVNEDSMARAVLAEWNHVTGQKLAAKEWLSKIVMRVREYPDLSIVDHGRIIRSAMQEPWWPGPASPSVVYGNGAQFERSLTLADERAGLARVRSVQGARARRYGRGMTTREILEGTGS